MKIQFLGATGTVTGSRYLVSHDQSRVLVDCGLYQGIKNCRLRNWQPFPVDPATIDAIILTHAHIDHSGYIPALIKQGFNGKVICSRGTRALCEVLLPDAGFLQEEDARYANRRHFSRHQPARPLFTEAEARAALKRFQVVSSHEDFKLGNGLVIRFSPVGHILGARSVRLSVAGKSVLFSGDLGRDDDLIMCPPEKPLAADYLVVESTYGNRRHPQTDPFEALARIINQTAARGGIVLMPSFAVGRAQAALWIIQQLKAREAIPDLPVYLNSPMAIEATRIFNQFFREHRLSLADCQRIDQDTHYVRTADESIALNRRIFPSIIISASGMASGGRVLHHLKQLAPDYRHSIVFMGFQAPGTRGESLINGAETVKIHGSYIPVRADVHNIDSLSAHADWQGIIDWLRLMDSPPVETFVTHGEPAAADAMRLHIREALGWTVRVPEYLETIGL